VSLSILIIAASHPANTIADALRRELDAAIEICPNRRAGLAALRREEFSLIVLEESLADADSEVTEQLYQKALATPILEINFAISNTHRVLRQIRAALVRGDQERAKARIAAAIALRNELKSSLTGLLLASELALREAKPDQEHRLRQLVEQVGELRNQLAL
jgi:hypothetical protein